MNNQIRKAPIYLLIDTSGSMMGEDITAVNNGVDLCIKTLRTDPVSMEKAFMSIITFADKAEVAMKMTYLQEVGDVPKFQAMGTTAMGDAIRLLNESLENDLVENTAEVKGDYKAFVVLFTDGRPTDKDVLDRELKKLNRRKINYFIAATTNESEDVKKVLVNVTQSEDLVFYLPASNAETFKKFFQWVTQSYNASVNRAGVPDNGEDYGDKGTGNKSSAGRLSDPSSLPPFPSFVDDGSLL